MGSIYNFYIMLKFSLHKQEYVSIIVLYFEKNSKKQGLDVDFKLK